MTSLTRHICLLLAHHDCVVVPGWGAFIAHREPASIDFDSFSAKAPRRWLSFNPAVATDDGVLARSVARREQVAYAKALGMIEGEVASMKARLALDGSLLLTGVGRFKMSAPEASPEFEPQPDGGAANSRFAWLPTLDDISAEDTNAPENATDLRQDGLRPRFPLWARVAAMLAVVVTLAFGVAGFLPERPAGNDYAAMTIAKPGTRTAASRVDTVMNSPVRLVIGRPNPDSSAVAVNQMVLDAPQAEVYYLIVASLPTERSARRFIARTGDQTLKILPSGPGRYRVYAAQAATFAGAEAYKHVPSIAKRYSQSWVCAGE